jgi:nicotinate-nucleotide pyrophosphorylase (carboxylating)
MSPDDCCQRLRWDDLDSGALLALIKLARDEDLAGHGLRRRPAHSGDVTSALLDSAHRGSADLVARHPMVVAGLPLVPLVLKAYGSDAVWRPRVRDGAAVAAGELLGTLEGAARPLLELERVLLNFLQRLSGVATTTARHVAALGASPTRLLDTRKTTPGLRLLEKYATTCGGGWNHRIGLFDRVMLKDNHLAATGSGSGYPLFQTIRRACETYPELLVEVEIDRPEQISHVLEAGAHILLLDNFTDAALAAAVREIAGRAVTEASGGITLERLPGMATLGLDFVSTGATIHHANWADIGLDWR